MSRAYPKLIQEQVDLLNAIEVGDLEETKRIIEEGVDPNFEINDGYAFSPVYLATLNNHLEIVVYLLDEGGVIATEKMHHWAAVVVGNISIANAIAKKLKK